MKLKLILCMAYDSCVSKQLDIQLTSRLNDSINGRTTLDHLNTLLESYQNLIQKK